MPTCSGKCVSGDLGTGGSRGSHGELRPAETLVTASQSRVSQGYDLDDDVTVGAFYRDHDADQPSFDPFKVSISSRSDDPIKPRETNIKFRSSQILHFISSRCFVGRAQALGSPENFHYTAKC